MRIVIVGAGVAGLGIGWRLVQAGAEVTLLERGAPGMGASFAAAGMLAVTAEMADAPPAEAAFAAQAFALWPGFAAELEAATAIAIGYRRNGALLLEPSRPAALPPGATWLDSEQARRRVSISAGMGAVWAPDEAQVDSRALGRALAAAFTAAGGTLRAGIAVTALETGAAVTEGGRFEADAVILAAGAWSGLIADVPLTPVKGQMIALAAPGGEIPDPVIWGNGVYLVPRLNEARLLVGATVEEVGFDTSLTPQARDDLRARAEAVLPRLKDWTLVEHWAGLRPRSPDGLPLLGRLGSGVYVAGGQYRNGILFAPAIAGHVRDLVLGLGPVIPEFDPNRFARSAS